MQAIVLEFEIEASGERARIPGGGLACAIHAVGLECARDLAGEASGEHDQALGILGEDFLIDARFVVEPFLVGRGEQAA